MRDRYDIGAELFRWQFAVSVAGTVLGVNPFDQPDVQRSKEETDSALEEYVRRGRLPDMEPEGSLEGLLDKSDAGDYLSIMAFVQQTPDTDRMIASLRRRAMEEHRIATTAGYGPRYLHSTGQLHKGGPDPQGSSFRSRREADNGHGDPQSTLHLRHGGRCSGDRRPEVP